MLYLALGQAVVPEKLSGYGVVAKLTEESWGYQAVGPSDRPIASRPAEDSHLPAEGWEQGRGEVRMGELLRERLCLA